MRKLLLLLMFVSLAAAQSSERNAKWLFRTGDYIVGSPVIHDDVVFIGSASGNLYAINSTTGTQIWKYGKVGRIESSASFSNSMVFFGSNDGTLYALWMNGTLAWSYKTHDRILSSPAFAYDVVYIGSTDGNFYALNAANGNVMWNYSGFSAFSSSPIASNWIIYAGSDEDTLYAFHAFNGTALWSQDFPGKIQSSFSLSPENVLYFPCKDGNIYAVYAGDGSKLWNIATGTEAQSSVHYSDETGIVYFGTTDSNVYAADKEGQIAWKYPTGNWVISTPTTKAGMLYVGSYDGNLYAISTIYTAFSASDLNATGSSVVIGGQSSADGGLKSVEVRVNNSPWVKAQGTGNWSYSWDTSSLEDGQYFFEARSIDANGNYELPPYAGALLNFTKKIALKELVVSFPDVIIVGLGVRFEVKDSDGNPVPNPQITILGKTYTGDEKGIVEKDEQGNPIKFDRDGEFNFTVYREGYAPNELRIKVLKMVDIVPYMAASLVIPLLVLAPVAYFVLKKLRGRKQ
ncbi:MAG: PQQ-binding-like beta-propeller repeat protein [Candidatus Micrarchaeota archaeon]|nr:PQQ-binding-like beta-propeller repeat protein [Candidatus Micrarchaeota archaeon]